jgi:chromosome partitioning protein
MIIAFVNHKGGVGKTTSALNIGAGLQARGYSTLLIDADAQANLTTSVGIFGEQPLSVYNVMKKECRIEETIIRREGEVDIVPAALDLSRIEREITSFLRKENILERALEPIRNQYDFILIDCPPSLGAMTINALAAADTAYIPISAELMPVSGLKTIYDTIEEIRQEMINPRLTVGGIIVTRFSKQKIVNQTVANDLRAQYGDVVFHTAIRENVALIESYDRSTDIFRYAPKSSGAQDYALLCEEMLLKTEAFVHA